MKYDLIIFITNSYDYNILMYSFKKAAAEKEKNWLIEVPQNVDPMTDMYEKKANEKSEKVAKNELQRLKNIARAKKVKIPRVGIPVTSDKASANQVFIYSLLKRGIYLSHLRNNSIIR